MTTMNTLGTNSIEQGRRNAARRHASVKPTSVQIYITAGALGRHAGVYSSFRCWAAHPTDDATAAWRAAMKFWFGKGQNSAWLFKQISRVTVTKNTDLTWQAALAPVPAPATLTKSQKTAISRSLVKAGLKQPAGRKK